MSDYSAFNVAVQAEQLRNAQIIYSKLSDKAFRSKLPADFEAADAARVIKESIEMAFDDTIREILGPPVEEHNVFAKLFNFPDGQLLFHVNPNPPEGQLGFMWATCVNGVFASNKVSFKKAAVGSLKEYFDEFDWHVAEQQFKVLQELAGSGGKELQP